MRQINKSLQDVLHQQDPASLHRLRVAVRRLRVVLALVRRTRDTRASRQATNALKWLAQALGPARDSDVFVGDIWPPLRAEIGNERLASALDAVWQAQKTRHYRTAQRALAAPRLRKLCVALDKLFAATAPGKDAKNAARGAHRFARDAIHRRVRRVRRRYARVLEEDPPNDRALHRLRIEIKKLRYELDILRPLLQGQRVTRIARNLARLQDTLGAMNDLAAAQFQVDAALRRRRGVAVEQVRHLLASRRKARMKALRTALHGAWKAYRQVQPFQ